MSNQLSSPSRAGLSRLKQSVKEWHRLDWLMPWLVLIFCLIVSYMMWRNEYQNANTELQADFDYRVREVDTRIVRHMKAYEQILRGLRGLFISSQKVTEGEFRDYVQALHLEDNYSGVHGVGFLPVLAAERERQRAPGRMTSGRFEGLPHYFVAYPGDEEVKLDHNVYADPRHRAAMDKARDTGEAVISGKLSLWPEAGEHEPMTEGFLMYLPVYRHGTRHADADERRANIVGWLYLPFHMMDLMPGIVSDVSDDVDIEIHDGTEVVDETMMYDPDISGVGGNPHAQFKSASRIEVGQHDWTVVIRSLYAFETRGTNGKPAIVAYAGMGVSLLLALLTWLLVRGRAAALRAHEEVNRELLERKRAEESLRLASTVVKAVEEAVMVTDADNTIIAVNPAFTAITGYAPEEAIGKNPRFLSSGKHPKAFFEELWKTLLQTDSWHGEIYDRRKNGEFYVKWLSVRAVRDEGGKLSNYVAVFSDITERKASEERMQHLAHFDVLTDLPNRVLFSDRLQQALVQARRDNHHLALMFLDLDKFKPINDQFGHAVGDLLLKETALRLQGCVRGSDTVSRVGGDEFIVLLPNVDNQQDALVVAEKMRHALSQPFELAGKRIFISVSIGVAVYPEHGRDERTLTKSADLAMYYAKSNLRDNVKLCQPEMIAHEHPFRAESI